MEKLKYLISLLDDPKAREKVIINYDVERYTHLAYPYTGGNISSSYHIKMYGDGRIELHGDGHDTDDFRPSTEQQLQYYIDDKNVCLFYRLLQKQKRKDQELKECKQKLAECQKRLNAVAKVIQTHKLVNKIMEGGKVYLSGPIVLEKVQQDGKNYIGVYLSFGCEKIYKDLLGLGGLSLDTNVLIDTDNKKALQYILDRTKIINIYDK